MALRLNGSSSGYVELEVPADAGSHTLTLPDGGGSSGQYLQTNGSGTLSWQTVTVPTVEWTDLGQTAFPNSSSTVTLTGINTNARVIRVAFSGLSVGDAASPQLRMRLGNGSESSTGYDYSVTYVANNQGASNQGNMNLMHSHFSGDANVLSGHIDLVSSQTHMIVTWLIGGQAGTTQVVKGVGRWTGGSAIDRINFTTASWFDAGHFAVYTLN